MTGDLTESVGDIVRRLQATRAGKWHDAGATGFELALDPGIGAEGFRIEDRPDGRAQIVGNDKRGLIYGVGKFLRDSAWRGVSVPKLPVRGVYFATHFHNYYHNAPTEQVQRYIEELALWGINSLTVWLDMHHFDGIGDPEAQAMIDRLRAFLQAAKTVGMDRGLTLIANEGYANSPVEMRATGPGRGGFYGVEVCPNAAGGQELILKQFKELFAGFADIGVNHVWIWPYDQGSCSCRKCSPWGNNGYLKIARPVSELARSTFPECKVYLSAWYMDDEEWTGLAASLSADHKFADGIILQPDHFGAKQDAPCPLPVLGFPEISMRGMFPWGGFGANPQPVAFAKYWDELRASAPETIGGWPYSEGIFEDINKTIFAQLYWDPDRPVRDIVREYASFEFSPEAADDFLQMVSTLERNHRGRLDLDSTAGYRWLAGDDPGAEEAYELAKDIDGRLTPQVRQSWRWRIVYLRALLDAELKANAGEPNAACHRAFEELTGLYFADGAEVQVKPPVFR